MIYLYPGFRELHAGDDLTREWRLRWSADEDKRLLERLRILAREWPDHAGSVEELVYEAVKRAALNP